MFQRFDGKTVVVTGGSKGIGKGIAKVFASAGANVAILARTTEEAEATAKEIQIKDGQTHAVFADVKDYDSMKAAVDEVATNMAVLMCFVQMQGYSHLLLWKI